MWYILALWALVIGMFADSTTALCIGFGCLVWAVIRDDRLYPYSSNYRRR